MADFSDSFDQTNFGFDLDGHQKEFDQPGYGPRDYVRGNQAASTCPTCGYGVAIPHFLTVDGNTETICECVLCGTLA